MGRQEKRHKQKNRNKKLTEEQFSALCSEANKRMVLLEVNDRIDKILNITFGQVAKSVMRSYRISEERADKIVKDILTKLKEDNHDNY